MTSTPPPGPDAVPDPEEGPVDDAATATVETRAVNWVLVDTAVVETASAVEPPAAVETATVETRAVERLEDVDLLIGDVWLAGRLDRGNFRRLSDYVNQAHGRILLHDAVHIRRGETTERLTLRDAWIDAFDLDVIGQRVVKVEPPPDDIAIEKQGYPVTALTSSQMISGTVHIHHEADLEAFLKASDPPLMVMTDAVVTWLGDGSVLGDFGLALVNRRRTFAVMAD